MAAKPKDVVTVVNGVTVTQCAYRGPRKGKETFPVSKSRYTAWHQTASRIRRGVGGVQGTVDSL